MRVKVNGETQDEYNLNNIRVYNSLKQCFIVIKKIDLRKKQSVERS